jgi:hypothetical protein
MSYRNKSTAEIAKSIRADIKAAIKAGKLPKGIKVSTRIHCYAGGSSIRVEVTELPDGFPVVSRERFAYLRANPRETLFSLPYELRERESPEGLAVLATLNAIVDVYHWDESDISADYFHCNFHRRISISDDLAGADEKRLREAAEAAPPPHSPAIVIAK